MRRDLCMLHMLMTDHLLELEELTYHWNHAAASHAPPRPTSLLDGT